MVTKHDRKSREDLWYDSRNRVYWWLCVVTFAMCAHWLVPFMCILGVFIIHWAIGLIDEHMQRDGYDESEY